MSKKFTDDQVREAFLASEGSVREAAQLLDCNMNSLQKRINRMRGADAGVFPIMPPGQKLKGLSSLQKIVDPLTGETRLQWVKTREDHAAAESAARIALEALKSEVPRAMPTLRTLSEPIDERLCAVFTITDYHLAMYSWAEETGDDWDMQIAEDLLVGWFTKALASSPAAKVGILAQLGDFLHYDSLEAVTPRSKHVLDADSRAQKMIRVGIRVLRRCIAMMLDKYESVHVLMAEGNHDPVSSAWLRETFKLYYENEPRVTVDNRPDPYYAFQWGDVGLFWHHGHLKKAAQLDRVFARKFREIYGAVKHCYGHCGHLHHKTVEETTLMEIEQHPTLAAADAYATRNGFLSSRAASVILYDREFGEVGRVRINPEMVKAQASR